MDRETETVINRLMSDLKAAQDLSAYLAANNKKLREALKYCVSALEQYEKQLNPPPMVKQLGDIKGFLLGALDNARAALKEGE